MKIEYEKPLADIVQFLTLQNLAHDDDGDRTRSAKSGDVDVDSSIPEVGDEDVGDW